MSKKLLVTFPNYNAEKVKKIEQLGYELIYRDETTVTYDDTLQDVEVIVGFNPFPTLDIMEMKNLKWIQLVSRGINHVPVEKIETKNILVTHNVQATAIPIAEWIVTYLLSIFKNTKAFIRKQDKKVWENDRDVLEIYGKKIGFLGTGNIAVQAAKRLKAFDAEIYGVNRSKPKPEYFDAVYKMDEADRIFKECDVIISTLPNTSNTYHVINEEAFQKMKKGVTLINISRGSIIDTAALIKHLKAGLFRGVALDVFEQEPLPQDSELWDFENVMITPHNVLYSDLYDERVFDMVYGNLKAYINGETPINQADFKKGY